MTMPSTAAMREKVRAECQKSGAPRYSRYCLRTPPETLARRGACPGGQDDAPDVFELAGHCAPRMHERRAPIGSPAQLRCWSRTVSRVLSPFRGGCHYSRTTVTGRLKQPTRKRGRAGPCASLFGLAPDGGCLAGRIAPPAGGLLPHRFTLTSRPRPEGGLLSVALSGDRSPLGVAQRPALRSPDFPLRPLRAAATARPTPNIVSAAAKRAANCPSRPGRYALPSR